MADFMNIHQSVATLVDDRKHQYFNHDDLRCCQHIVDSTQYHIFIVTAIIGWLLWRDHILGFNTLAHYAYLGLVQCPILSRAPMEGYSSQNLPFFQKGQLNNQSLQCHVL